MRILFDASALLNIIRALGDKSLSYIREGYELTLTPYEIGNALWKEVTLLRRISVSEALTLLKFLSIICEKYLVTIDPQDRVSILKLAHALKLTYYDASYVVAANEHEALLVTDDTKLRESIKLHKDMVKRTLGANVEVVSSNEYITLKDKFNERR